MEIVTSNQPKQNSSSWNTILLSESLYFPDWKIFEGDAGQDPFFDLRMKASIIAMAQFLDYIDQTETYQYYPYGIWLQEAADYDDHQKDYKNIVLQLAAHSYIFEQEMWYSRNSLFQQNDWVKATLHKVDLWPHQTEIRYDFFVSSSHPALKNKGPIYRRVEVAKIISTYQKKLEKFSFNQVREWTHLWQLILKTSIQT